MAQQLITVVETQEFKRRADTRMSEQERQEFITFIAGSPENGAVMRGTVSFRPARLTSIYVRFKSGL